MATLEIEGIEELENAFQRICSIPDSLKEKVLKEMGEEIAAKVKSAGESMGVRDPESNVHILDKIKVGKVKTSPTGGHVDVTFSGTRNREGTVTRNAAIAFINEYGRRSQPARPFISLAIAESGDQILTQAMEEIGDWIENEYAKN